MSDAAAGVAEIQDRSFRYSPLAIACVVAGAVLLHIALNGYAFGGCTDALLVTSPSSDHANILPWIHWYSDHTLYRHDFEIQMGASYATVLWHCVAVAARIVPLEWTFFLLHLLSLAATHLMLFLSARRLVGSDNRRAADWAGVLACAFFVVARDGPAGEATHDAAFYTRGAALPLALLCVWLVLGARGYAAFAVLAATVAVHSLTAFYVAPIAAAAWLLTPGLTAARRWLPLVGGAIAAGATAWLVGGGQAVRLGAPSEAWLQLQRGNNVMHVFPRAWSEAVWHDFAACAVFLLPAMLGGPAVLRRFAVAGVLGGVVMAALGWGTTEIAPSMLFIQLQPFRGLKFTMIAGLLCAAAVIATLVRSGGGGKEPPLPPLCKGGRRTAANAGRWTAAAVCTVGLMLRQDVLITAGCAMLCMVSLRGAARWLTLVVPAAAAAWFVAAGVSASRSTWAATSAAMPWERTAKGSWRYVRNLDFPFVARTSAWVDVQRWVLANTPVDALVLTPPILEGFRTYARRSEFVDWKQGTLSMFHEAFGMEWARRLSRLMPRRLDRRDAYNLALNYDALGENEFFRLARDYGVTHMVVAHRRAMPGLRELYDNGVFRVLAMK